MSAASEGASAAATLALVRAVGIPGYATDEKTTVAAEFNAWDQALTIQERADVAFLLSVGAIGPGSAP